MAPRSVISSTSFPLVDTDFVFDSSFYYAPPSFLVSESADSSQVGAETQFSSSEQTDSVTSTSSAQETLFRNSEFASELKDSDSSPTFSVFETHSSASIVSSGIPSSPFHLSDTDLESETFGRTSFFEVTQDFRPSITFTASVSLSQRATTQIQSSISNQIDSAISFERFSLRTADVLATEFVIVSAAQSPEGLATQSEEVLATQSTMVPAQSEEVLRSQSEEVFVSHSLHVFATQSGEVLQTRSIAVPSPSEFTKSTVTLSRSDPGFVLPTAASSFSATSGPQGGSGALPPSGGGLGFVFGIIAGLLLVIVSVVFIVRLKLRKDDSETEGGNEYEVETESELEIFAMGSGLDVTFGESEFGATDVNILAENSGAISDIFAANFEERRLLL
jgi:hypothetical protein